MWYEINISKNGHHLFATHERSLGTISQVKEALNGLRQAFREEDGFKFTVTQWETTGKELDINKL